MHIIYYYHKFQGIIYWILLFLSDLNDTRSSDLSIVIFLILAVLCLKIHVPYHSLYMFDKKDVFTNIIGMKKLYMCIEIELQSVDDNKLLIFISLHRNINSQKKKWVVYD